MTEAAVAGLRLLVAQVAAMDAADRRRLVEELPVAHQRTLLEQWPVWAHQGQLPASEDWRVWLRGATMGHWLAAARNGQHAEVMQRFDPRFWTVNFPRPMMAAVTTIGETGDAPIWCSRICRWASSAIACRR